MEIMLFKQLEAMNNPQISPKNVERSNNNRPIVETAERVNNRFETFGLTTHTESNEIKQTTTFMKTKSDSRRIHNNM